MSNIHRHDMFWTSRWMWRYIFIVLECVWAESMRVLHPLSDARLCLLVDFMHLQVCYVQESVSAIHMYVPTSQLMMSTSQWGSNFTAELMWEFLFLHPAFSSRWDSISPRPYWFIITYFDYLSMGSHIKHYCGRDIKRPSPKERDRNRGVFLFWIRNHDEPNTFLVAPQTCLQLMQSALKAGSDICLLSERDHFTTTIRISIILVFA